jgi:hypothetical protein
MDVGRLVDNSLAEGAAHVVAAHPEDPERVDCARAARHGHEVVQHVGLTVPHLSLRVRAAQLAAVVVLELHRADRGQRVGVELHHHRRVRQRHGARARRPNVHVEVVCATLKRLLELLQIEGRRHAPEHGLRHDGAGGGVVRQHRGVEEARRERHSAVREPPRVQLGGAVERVRRVAMLEAENTRCSAGVSRRQAGRPA